MTTTQERAAIDPATRVGFVSLTISDLDRSLAFYSDLLGFALLQHNPRTAVLGAGDAALLVLEEERGADSWARGYTGLHHFAVLLPTRGDLGRSFKRLLDHGYQPTGEDHNVSEAIYFADPDGHGIELYADRSRELWGAMGERPFDAVGLQADVESENKPWEGLPEGTRIGHMHVRVGDIERARSFYHGVLGFDVMAEMPDALFVSAGGYHHHVGMNTWFSKGASGPPPHMTGLRFFTLELPSDDALSAAVTRITNAGLAVDPAADGVIARDPWGTKMVLRARADLDSQGVAALAGEV